MKEFRVGNFNYRIKKMNAIQLLALRSSMNFDDSDKLQACFERFLENIEVQVKDDKWLQVKQGNDYYPANIEEDIDAIQELIHNFVKYIKSVFTKSSESNT